LKSRQHEDVAHARVGEFLEPPCAGAIGDVARVERRLGVAILEVLADHGRVGEGHPVVDEDRNAPERAQLGEAVVAHEGDDRIDLVGDALRVQADEHLAHVG